ncbi:hypothetical protein T08_11719 [Trichinella sp. T8]|nr:hypothetical protein T08_11719 [Trichinella sp. T8]
MNRQQNNKTPSTYCNSLSTVPVPILMYSLIEFPSKSSFQW